MQSKIVTIQEMLNGSMQLTLIQKCLVEVSADHQLLWLRFFMDLLSDSRLIR